MTNQWLRPRGTVRGTMALSAIAAMTLASTMSLMGCGDGGAPMDEMGTAESALSGPSGFPWKAPKTLFLGGTLADTEHSTFEGKKDGPDADRIFVRLSDSTSFWPQKSIQAARWSQTRDVDYAAFNLETGEICMMHVFAKEPVWTPREPACSAPPAGIAGASPVPPPGSSADPSNSPSPSRTPADLASYLSVVDGFAMLVGTLADGHPAGAFPQDPMPELAPFRDYFQSLASRLRAPQP